jgi:hypothetical protein
MSWHAHIRQRFALYDNILLCFASGTKIQRLGKHYPEAQKLGPHFAPLFRISAAGLANLAAGSSGSGEDR